MFYAVREKQTYEIAFMKYFWINGLHFAINIVQQAAALLQLP